VAHGSKQFLSTKAEPRALMQGGVCYVAAEDPPEVIRRRLFAIRARAIANYTRICGEDKKKLAEMIKKGEQDVLQNFHISNVVGKDVHLINTETGEVRQGEGVDWLIEDFAAIKNLALVILDPLARLHGGDENSNAVTTALINAAERIAQQFGCAVIVIHHVSKQAASDKNMSAHAGRGGSAFGDGARSVLRLLPVERSELKGLVLLDGRTGNPLAQADIDDGNVVRVHHAKSSYGPRQRDIFLLRDRDTGELLTLKVVADARDPYHANIGRLKGWIQARGGAPITKSLVKSSYKDIAPPLSREDTLTLLEDAIARGVLVSDPDYRGKNPEAAGYVLAQVPEEAGEGGDGIPADTGGIPAEDPASMADDGGEGFAADTGETPPSYTPPVYFAGIQNGPKKASKKAYRRDTGGKSPRAQGSKNAR
jgi:hypothetical protein